MPESHPPAKARFLRPELVLLLASLAVSLLLAEGVLRLVYTMNYSGTLEDLNSRIPEPGSEVTFGDMLTLSDSSRLVYVFKPNLDVRFKGARVLTNEQGFREATLPAPKGETTLRIVGLGDSVMFGLGVEEAERYMDVLEERLEHDFPAASWETITLAIPGYNLVTEVAALERYGFAYGPDLLIYGFVYNDFCLPNFVSRRRSVWSFESFIKYYLSRGRRGEALVHRKDASLASQGITPAELKKQDRELFNESYCNAENIMPEYRHLVGQESFHQALERLARLGRERNVPTIFLSYGSARRVDDIPLPEGMIFIDFHKLYRKYLRENHFKNIKSSDLVLSEADLHPSVKGHRMIGTALARRLAELGLIDELLARRAP